MIPLFCEIIIGIIKLLGIFEIICDIIPPEVPDERHSEPDSLQTESGWHCGLESEAQALRWTASQSRWQSPSTELPNLAPSSVQVTKEYDYKSAAATASDPEFQTNLQ